MHPLLGSAGALASAGALGSLTARALTAGFLFSMMLSMGLALGASPKEHGAAKRQQRHLLVRGLLINLVLLPLVAVLLTRMLHASGEAATALLLLAAAPGGRYAPMLARLAQAELGLSVEVTLFLAKLTAFTAPPTVHWMLHTNHFDLPELRIIGQLVLLQLLPYLAGKLIYRHRPAWAAWLERPTRVAVYLFVVLIVGFLVSHHTLRSVLVMGTSGWLAALMLALLALTIGWLLGGPTTRTRRSIAISGCARDGALALFIATLLFPDSPIVIAVFGEWLVFVACGAAFAAIVGRRHTLESGIQPHAV